MQPQFHPRRGLLTVTGPIFPIVREDKSKQDIKNKVEINLAFLKFWLITI